MCRIIDEEANSRTVINGKIEAVNSPTLIKQSGSSPNFDGITKLGRRRGSGPVPGPSAVPRRRPRRRPRYLPTFQRSPSRPNEGGGVCL